MISELESHKFDLTNSGSDLEGQLSIAQEKVSTLSAEVGIAKQRLASFEAAEKVYSVTYESAKTEIKELRAVERSYHELKTIAAVASTEGQQMSKTITELQSENSRLLRNYDETHGRLESEVVHAEEVSSHLLEARNEISRLEERCRSLAEAQAPLSDLSEKLMEQLKERDQDAIEKRHLEEKVKSMESKSSESQAEVQRLSEMFAQINTTASQTLHTLSAIQDRDERHSFGDNIEVLRITSGYMHHSSAPSSSSLRPHVGGTSTTANNAKTSVDEVVRQLERLVEKNDVIRIKAREQEESFGVRIEEFENQISVLKEKELAGSKEASRLSLALADKSRELSEAQKEIAEAGASLVEAERLAIDAEEEKRNIIHQLQKSSQSLRDSELIHRNLEASKSSLESLLAARDEERNELNRILHSSRFVSELSANNPQQQHSQQHGHGHSSFNAMQMIDNTFSTLTHEMNQEVSTMNTGLQLHSQGRRQQQLQQPHSLVSEVTEFALSLSKTENERNSLQRDKEQLEEKLASQVDEFTSVHTDLMESNGQIKALMDQIEAMEPLKNNYNSFTKEVTKVCDSLNRSAGGKGGHKGSDNSGGFTRSSSDDKELLSHLKNSIESALEVQAVSAEKIHSKLSKELAMTQTQLEQCQLTCASLTSSLESAKTEMSSLKESFEKGQSETSRLQSLTQQSSKTVQQKDAIISANDKRMLKLADRVVAMESEIKQYQFTLSVAERKWKEEKERLVCEYDIEISSLKHLIAQSRDNDQVSEKENNRIADLFRAEIESKDHYISQLKDWGHRQKLEVESILAETKATHRLSEAQIETIKFDMSTQQRVSPANHITGAGGLGSSSQNKSFDEEIVFGAARDLREGLRLTPVGRLGSSDDQTSTALRERKLVATVSSLQEEMEMEKRMTRDEFTTLERNLENAYSDLTTTQEQFLRFSNIISANMSHLNRLATTLVPLPKQDATSSSHVRSTEENQTKFQSHDSEAGNLQALRLQLEHDIVTEKRKTKALSDTIDIEKQRSVGLQSIIQQLEQSLATQEQEMENMRSELNQKMQTIQSQKHLQPLSSSSSPSATNDELHDKDEQIAALVFKTNQLSKQINELKKMEEKANSKLQSLVNEHAAQVKVLTKRCEESEQTKQRELEEANKKHNSKVDGLKVKISELEEELSTLALDHDASLQTPSSIHEAEIQAMKNEMEELRKDKQKAITEARNRQAETLKDCQDRTTKLQAEMLEQHRKRSSARQEEISEIEHFKNESNNLASDLRVTQEEVQSLSTQLSDTQGEVEHMKEENKEYSNELSHTKEKLRNAQRLSAESDERLASLLDRLELLESSEAKHLIEITAMKEAAEVRKRELVAKSTELEIALRQADISKEQKEYNRFLSENQTSEITELKSRITFLENEKSTSNEDIHRLTQRTKELSDRLGTSESLRAQLERQLSEIQRKYDTLFVKMESQTQEQSYSENRISDELGDRETIRRLDSEVSQLQTSLLESRRHASLIKNEVEVQLKEKSNALDRAMRNIATLETKLRDMAQSRAGEENVRREYLELRTNYENLLNKSHDTEDKLRLREDELKKKVKMVEGEVLVLRESLSKTSTIQQEVTGLRTENNELRSQLKETTSSLLLMKPSSNLSSSSSSSSFHHDEITNVDVLTGGTKRVNDKNTDLLTRRIKELEIDLKNMSEDSSLREKEYRTAIESEIAVKKHAERLQHDLSVESSNRLQVELELESAKVLITNLESNISKLEQNSPNSQELSNLREQLSEKTSNLNDKEKQLKNYETQRTKLETSLSKAMSTIAVLKKENESHKETLLEKEDEVRGLLTLNEQLLIRAEKALEKSRDRKKNKQNK